jgi:hypothetical protein
MSFQQIRNTSEMRSLGKENAIHDAFGKLSIAAPRPILINPLALQHSAGCYPP